MKGRLVFHNDGTRTCYIDGQEVSQAEWDAAFPPRTGGDGPCSLSSVPPNVSDGLAVHPRQVEEARESARRKGVPTEFLPDGRPVMRSRAHQKAYLKAYGFHNRDGGYGD